MCSGNTFNMIQCATAISKQEMKMHPVELGFCSSYRMLCGQVIHKCKGLCEIEPCTTKLTFILRSAGLYGKQVPKTVQNFLTLIRSGSYNSTLFNKASSSSFDELNLLKLRNGQNQPSYGLPVRLQECLRKFKSPWAEIFSHATAIPLSARFSPGSSRRIRSRGKARIAEIRRSCCGRVASSE